MRAHSPRFLPYGSALQTAGLASELTLVEYPTGKIPRSLLRGVFNCNEMNIIVLTIFPTMFALFWEHGMIKRAIDNGIILPRTINIRDFATDRHRTTDDRPFGGGCGMVMKPEPLAAALREAKKQAPGAVALLLSPQGRPFRQEDARIYAASKDIILVCGRYEGIDERIEEAFIDDEISIGDFVMTGGELAAMAVMDAVARMIPGTLGNEDSAENDSFADGLLEHAHYTRPRSFEGADVPEVLLSGNHRAIDNWRKETALMRTFLKRPDLLLKKPLDRHEVDILKKWQGKLEAIIALNKT